MKTTVLLNTAACNIIIPFVGSDLDGLVSPTATIEVGEDAMETDFVRGCIERGELTVVTGTLNISPIDELRNEAEELGIKVDGRWSIERIQAEIDKLND